MFFYSLDWLSLLYRYQLIICFQQKFYTTFWWFGLVSISFFLFKLFVWGDFKEFLYIFLCFSMPLDNNVWYARAAIFNSRTKNKSPNVWYSYDINFFMNLFNKMKSQLKLSLSFFIFVWAQQYYFYLFTFYLFYFFTKSDSIVVISTKKFFKLL